MPTVRCVAAVGAELGEGTLWDPLRGVIWWVDIRRARLHCYQPDSGAHRTQALGFRVTALGLTADDGLIACGDPGFIRLAVDRELQVRLARVLTCPTERPGNRFNDGKVDATGCFWAGTMDDAESGSHGRWYRLDAAGRATVIQEGVGVPNGPCFLADGTVLITDSPRRLITALQLDARGGVYSRRDFARFTDTQGYPDGMTVDAENHVWVAFWDGWCVRRLSPAGHIVAEIPLPVQRPTCPTFGGTHLRQLYISSATTGLRSEQLAAQPMAGGLLVLEPGVAGRAPERYRG